MVSRSDATIDELLDTAVVAVVRTQSAHGIQDLAGALIAGGVRHIEITTTVPHALKVIADVADAVGDQIHVGAGTVLDPASAQSAIQAGARYLVSPILDPTVIEQGHQHGVPVIPGCLTPTEIACALRWGADVIKLFPGRVATPGYFADVLGPFPGSRLMPTGNVDRDTAGEYMRAGAVAVGVGKAIVDPTDFAEQRWSEISRRAQEFIDVVRIAKKGAL